MENTYGIGIANRYDLFYQDDDEQDPFEQLKQKKQKAAKVKTAIPATQPGQLISQTSEKSQKTINVISNNKNAEKENNKSASNKNQNNEQIKAGSVGTKQGTSNAQRVKAGVKDSINVKPQENRGLREDKEKIGYQAKNFDRQHNKQEERNNRRNRDGNEERRAGGGIDRQNGPTGDFSNREDRPRRQQGGNSEGGNRPRFDRRGKREFDRQSGSDKTGVKAVDKRDGAGAHNWGSHKQDLDDLSKGTDYLTDGEKNDSNVEETKEETDPQLPTEEEPKEMTLDEWKAQRAANRTKPQYNLRKVGDENKSQFENMIVLSKKKDNEESEESDTGAQKAAENKKKQILEIDIHFADNRRAGGGLGRPRGRGNRQGNNNSGATDRPNRPNRNNRYNERGGKDVGIDRRGPAAPKVDDEHDFPCLG